MKKILLFGCKLYLYTCLSAQCPDFFSDTSNLNLKNNISHNNNLFAFDLYERISAVENGNIFFSPFSISTCLAMTYAGSDGNTAEEIGKVFRFLANDTHFHSLYSQYIKTIKDNAGDNIQLRIANRLWGEKQYKFLNTFIKLTETFYDAPMERLDFRYNPEQSRIFINEWIEKKTENKITELIPKGEIDGLTRLVLTNAIYFKGNWLIPFDTLLTKKRKFYINHNNAVEVDFMHSGDNKYFYYENKNYKMLKLFYSGSKQSMIIVLPHKNISISEIEKHINVDILFENLLLMKNHEVNVALPLFEITQPLNLGNILKEMGMREAFSHNANFTKMSKTRDLYISSVVHKAFIEINEEGTEAAAATAVIMRLTSVGPKAERKEFIADSPFLFYLIDDQTGAILFMGRVINPVKQ